MAGTRWWPPFCMVVDAVAAATIAVEIAAGVTFGPAVAGPQIGPSCALPGRF